MIQYSGRRSRSAQGEASGDAPIRTSIDDHPWLHPFLEHGRIARFSAYSKSVWEHASAHDGGASGPVRCAFTDNMAQNMHNWAVLVQRYGWPVALFPHPLDSSAINAPEWEVFDGAYDEIQQGEAFLAAYSELEPLVTVRRARMDDAGLLQALIDFEHGNRRGLLRILSENELVRYEPLLAYAGGYPYFTWARELSQFDVIYAASTPFAAYASGKPYCAFSVGGDLQYVCGRSDDLGAMMSLAFNAARFVLVSNPHTLGHLRRLGFRNGVYLPYPVDDKRYRPGTGRARQDWTASHGEGVYVLSAARLDDAVKGQVSLFDALLRACRDIEELRFVFLSWGNDADLLKRRVLDAGMQRRMLVLPPVGKKRLIDYYRSSDVLLDGFVFGYYGATLLEAAAVGLPVITMIRREHYAPLYGGDTAPVCQACTSADVYLQLERLVGSRERRLQAGEAMRAWLLRNHGSERTVPLLTALLRLTANRSSLPATLHNPLDDPLMDEELEYHEACLRNPE